MYELRFWFEHGGGCLWSKNKEAKDKFGYLINTEKLPLSKKTSDEIKRMENWYHSYLDWSCPSNPSPWTDDEKKDFLKQAKQLYDTIVFELGKSFSVINEVQNSINKR